VQYLLFLCKFLENYGLATLPILTKSAHNPFFFLVMHGEW
jgi:hypothetical protein